MLALARESAVELPLTVHVTEDLASLQARVDGGTEVTVLAEMAGRGAPA